MRVAILPERYGAVFSPCASIRLQPFVDEMCRKGELQARYLLLPEVEKYAPDVIIWHRVSLRTQTEIEELAKIGARTHARLVYDIDDNLLDLVGHGEQASYASTVEAVRQSLMVADDVWCSTPNLAERVEKTSRSKPAVLPNALDPELWRRSLDESADAKTYHGPFRLLYMGTRTHDADFALLQAALEQIHAESPGSFELSLVGVRVSETLTAPWLRPLQPPAHIGASYPAFVHWLKRLKGFDLGMAPLLAGSFNDCKSSIKVLDYAAIGLPTLASNVPAYTHSLQSGINCLHADNDVAGWIRTIREAMADRTMLGRIAHEAAKLVTPARFQEATDLRLQKLRALVSSTDRSSAMRPVVDETDLQSSGHKKWKIQ